MLIFIFISSSYITSLYITNQTDVKTESSMKLYGYFISGEIDKFQTILTHFYWLDYQGASKYVLENYSNHAPIISGAGFCTFEYYLPVKYSTDFYLGKELGYFLNESYHDMYLGTPIISDKNYLESLGLDDYLLVSNNYFREHSNKEVYNFFINHSVPVYNSKEVSVLYNKYNSDKIKIVIFVPNSAI